MADETKNQPDYCCAAHKKMTRGWQIMRDTVAGALCLRVPMASIGAELVTRQVVARIDRSLFLYPVGGRYDMLEWL